MSRLAAPAAVGDILTPPTSHQGFAIGGMLRALSAYQTTTDPIPAALMTVFLSAMISCTFMLMRFPVLTLALDGAVIGKLASPTLEQWPLGGRRAVTLGTKQHLGLL